ncbi:ABC transporter permease [Methanobrevibacter sp.]|uniref:ABC transporter permease n=1 Tax=Methanobrevibacter sp. TaxID=66852 RepID=UPI002E787874|nr:ABC transporter permease [Methanobrevibacter sp.]MEE0939934.1 ABC transporter permease [Methanobrevibacter sp.]
MNSIKKNDIFLLEEIVKKNFSSKYKDSVLGVLWTILSPLLMMALFTIIFSTLFGRNIDNYAVYFLCGWCLFTFFSSSISVSMDALKGNKSILQRTPAPKYIFVLGGILSEFLNYLIMLILLVVIMFITHATFHFPLIFCSIIPIILLFIMIVGLSLMLSIACVYYTDIKHLWRVVSMMLMYASAIFYPMDIIPEPFRGYMLLNPLYWAIDQFRCFVYQGIVPNGINLINFLLLSLIILICGIIVFEKYEDKVVTKF